MVQVELRGGGAGAGGVGAGFVRAGCVGAGCIGVGADCVFCMCLRVPWWNHGQQTSPQGILKASWRHPEGILKAS